MEFLDTFIAGAATAALTTLMATQRRVRRLRSMLLSRYEIAARASLSDAVTGLPNREAFLAALAGRLQRGAPFVLMKLDIDGFRALRAMHGRCVSDALLRAFADRLGGLLPEGSVAARMQGDEFGVLLALESNGALHTACGATLAAMKRPYTALGVYCDVSLCIGVAVLPRQGDSVETALNAAYLALEQAKRAGGGTWHIYDPREAALCERQNRLKSELKSAIEANQFIPYYQPIVELETGAISGVEVLARWQHPRLGLLAPNDFIELAEQQNLCGALSMSLLRQVTADYHHWPAHWRFAFNAAPGQLHDLVHFVRDPAEYPGGMLPANRIDLEITENAVIQDLDLARALIRKMHASGTRVVLDDFGTGYANFLHLRELSFDRIKIDKCFVSAMLTDARSAACVRAMLALGSSLGVAVTAEGVETEAVASRLRAMGCSHAQGYLYARPLPAAAVTQLAACGGFARAPLLSAPA
jgi:diguanylate cyclase (GGDEF)-like protein